MRVAICLPSHGTIYEDHRRSLRKLLLKHPEWVPLEISGTPCIDLSRSSLAEDALCYFKETEILASDMILWIDADITFSAETCEQILAEASSRQAIVGCLYAGKEFGAAPQVAPLTDFNGFVCFNGGSVVEVKAIGFGLVAHPVWILESIATKCNLPRLEVLDKKLRPWFTTRSDGAWEQFHSDDYAFCRRARETGFKVYADTRQRVGHIGLHTFQLEDATALLRCKTLNLYPLEKKETVVNRKVSL